jgi:serine/threonine-protein kinase HipA
MKHKKTQTRKGQVYCKGVHCGSIEEDTVGYVFRYSDAYLALNDSPAISVTLPKTLAAHRSNILFPFFDGLIPEGWLLDLAETNWKITHRDRMGLLLSCCKDTIGAVAVVKDEKL